MPLEFAGPWPPEADIPQVGFKEPPDHHEAYWLYGYDPVSKVGHYLYLAAEKDDVLLRRESVFLLLPDGSVLAQHGAGRGSHGAYRRGRPAAARVPGAVPPLARPLCRPGPPAGGR